MIAFREEGLVGLFRPASYAERGPGSSVARWVWCVDAPHNQKLSRNARSVFGGL
jgi:hypothetical protein